MPPGNRRHLRVVLLVALLTVLGLLLTQCPANRDGTPGVLAHAMTETTSAVRSAALALDLRMQDRSPAALTAVQVTDARDEIAGAFSGVTELAIEDPVDVNRQRMLIDYMTGAIAELNSAAARLHDLDGQPPLQVVHRRLLALADELERGYR